MKLWIRYSRASACWYVEFGGRRFGSKDAYLAFATWREAIDYVTSRWTLAATVID